MSKATERPDYLKKKGNREIPGWVVFVSYPGDPGEYNVYFRSKDEAINWRVSPKKRPIRRLDGPYAVKVQEQMLF